MVMHYLFLIYGAESCWNDEQRQQCMLQSMEVCQQLAEAGQFRFSTPLQYVRTAKTVRRDRGQHLITDGPFAETTEQLGGFYILELESREEAVAVALRLPPVSKGTVEIRPIQAAGLLLDSNGLSEPAPTGYQRFMLLGYTNGGTGRFDLKSIESRLPSLRAEMPACRLLAVTLLEDSQNATSVQVREGRTLLRDGSFESEHAQLAIAAVVQVEDAEMVATVARQLLGPELDRIEVRPLFDLSILRPPEAAETHCSPLN